MSKISDFKLAYAAILDMSRKAGTPAKDLEVSFDTSGVPVSAIVINDTNSLPHTLYQIVEQYINNAIVICGRELFSNEDAKTMFLMHFAATARSMSASETYFDESDIGSFSASRLYHEPFVWNAMKNIVCPLNDINIKNVLIVEGSSESVDVTRFYESGSDDPLGPNEPFIFVNRSIKSKPIMQAHLLLSAIEAHDLDSYGVVKRILEGPAYRQFIGLAGLACSDNKEEFVSVLMKISDLKPSDFPHIKDAAAYKKIKTAQWYDSPGQTSNSQWWWFGLPEKMLEPTRGFDWSVREGLEHRITEFWDSVESIKEKMPQGEGVPFDNLLRLKADEIMDTPTDTNMTIQGLLREQRIWQ